MELIRSAEVADQFRDGVRALVAGAKPVAITGFGTATWRGAGEIAPRSMEIVEHDPHSGVPVRLDDAYQRDEEGQARYLTELLEIFEAEPGLEIYWGAYLGTEDEILRSGEVLEVMDEIEQVRGEARTRKGWIMDTYLLRPLRPGPDPAPE